MRKYLVYFILFAFPLFIAFGCGQGGGESVGSTTTTIPSTPVVGVTSLFDISGSVAVMSATKVGVGGGAVKTLQGSEGDILKYTSTGEVASIFTSTYYHPQVTAIEKNPVDGSLYIGLASGIYVGEPSTGEPVSKQYAFFRIKPDGSVEVVDENIASIGSWYSSSYGSELPAKQIQFDSAGNVYYLGQTSSGSKVLKMKSTSGNITQIGSSAYYVYDFLVGPNGYVLFHGADSSSYSTEWLKIFSGSSVYTIYYNTSVGPDSSLRSYFLDRNNNVILVGSGLRMFVDPSNPDTSPIRRYAGVIRVRLNSSGAPIATEVLLDDYNMYSAYSIGNQLVYGYWDPATGNYVDFFAKDNYVLRLPLELRAGVSEEAIRAFIRKRFRIIASDNLNSITFAGLTTSEPSTMGNYLDYLIGQKITGETWQQWRENNGLSSDIHFYDAKQVLPAEDGSVYLVIKLDPWGTSGDKGEKIFRVLNASGEVDMTALPRHATFLLVKKAKIFGDYLLYISERLNYGKVFRLNLKNISESPVDLTEGRSGIQIFSLNYNSATGKIMYDIYDGNTNTSSVVEQDLVSTTVSGSGEVSGYKITDIVPFASTK